MDYQVMPDLSPEEYEELKADIAERGVMVPVELDEDGNVLDGHHRLRACQELGITDYPRIVRTGMTEEEKRTHARKLNMLRRQLSREQKQELIRQQLRETPERSDRQIAAMLGASPTTVGTLRRELEQSGQVSKLDTSTGADGKQYPRQVERKTEPECDEAEGRGEIPHVETVTDTLGRVQPRQVERKPAAPDYADPWAGIGEILASNPPARQEPDDSDGIDINSFFEHVQRKEEEPEPSDNVPPWEPADVQEEQEEPEPEDSEQWPFPEPDPEGHRKDVEANRTYSEIKRPPVPEPEPEPNIEPEPEPENVVGYHEFLNAQAAQMDKWRKVHAKFYAAVMFPTTHDADEIAEAAWNLMRRNDPTADGIDHEITDTIQALSAIQGKIRMGAKLYGCHGTQ